jgi:hydroxymethylglutaryl-CoA lyase
MPAEVHIVEVSPRDGLQNESTPVSTAVKVELVLAAAAAGLRRIEVTSFVNPKAVAQMADAEAVLAGVRDRLPSPAPELSAVALNARGIDRAIAAGVDAVTFVMLATEEFNRRNQGCSREESMRTWRETAKRLRDHGIHSTFMLGASFGCPFSGEVAPSDVLGLVRTALEADPDEIALADTIGCGVPPQVTELFGGIRELTGGEVPMRVHLHNTRNSGYANAFAAVAAGVTALDASIGGIGGCPFAPAATGNIATEDLAWMLQRARIDDSVSVAELIQAARVLVDNGVGTSALIGRAAPFPEDAPFPEELSGQGNRT